MSKLESRNAKIITIGTPKGGSGKSTLAETISVELAYMGYKVLVYDMDSTGTLTNMIIRRNALIQHLIDSGEEPIPSISQISKSPSEKDVRRRIYNMRNDYDYIIIDNHGEAEVEFQYTCQIADIVLYPIDNSTKEIEQIPKMIELVEGVNEGRRIADPDAESVNVLMVVNKVDGRKREAHTKFKERIKNDYSEYIKLAKTFYPLRENFKKTEYGTTVSDEKLPERATVQLLIKEIQEEHLNEI